MQTLALVLCFLLSCVFAVVPTMAPVLIKSSPLFLPCRISSKPAGRGCLCCFARASVAVRANVGFLSFLVITPRYSSISPCRIGRFSAYPTPTSAFGMFPRLSVNVNSLRLPDPFLPSSRFVDVEFGSSPLLRFLFCSYADVGS